MEDYYIGWISGILTSASVVPQLVKIIREKKAVNVSVAMYLVLIAGEAGWIWYGALKKDIPIISTNCFAFIINLLIIIFAIKYKGRDAKKAV
jgi:MtN3 and saliva related transmembrane protein